MPESHVGLVVSETQLLYLRTRDTRELPSPESSG